MRLKFILLLGITFASAFSPYALSTGDPARGEKLFRTCAACHSLRPGEHLTGPSLANVFGRRAGTVKGFARYSEAIRKTDIVWNEKTLDAWITKPAELIPNNLMTFAGIRDAEQRAHLIAFLKTADASKARADGMMGPPPEQSLRKLEPSERVTTIRYCQDSYFVTLASGQQIPFWERNLRFKTNGTPAGPTPGEPAIMRAGMAGDRASIVFAGPDEISQFIKKRCDPATR